MLHFHKMYSSSISDETQLKLLRLHYSDEHAKIGKRRRENHQNCAFSPTKYSTKIKRKKIFYVKCRKRIPLSTFQWINIDKKKRKQVWKITWKWLCGQEQRKMLTIHRNKMVQVLLRTFTKVTSRILFSILRSTQKIESG